MGAHGSRGGSWSSPGAGLRPERVSNVGWHSPKAELGRGRGRSEGKRLEGSRRCSRPERWRSEHDGHRAARALAVCARNYREGD